MLLLTSLLTSGPSKLATENVSRVRVVMLEDPWTNMEVFDKLANTEDRSDVLSG